MSNINYSANMNLPIPVVGTDFGPDWATNLNACLALLDQHNHTAGAGTLVPSSGLNINADLPFNGMNATLLRSSRYSTQISTLAGGADLNCVYVSGVDLYYNDGNGNQIRLTNSGSVAGASGNITNLASPASVTYVSGTPAFVFQSASSTPANLDGGSYTFRNITASSKGITMQAPNALASNFTLTLPTLPAQQNVMTLDNTGAIASVTWDSVGTSMTSVGAQAIATTMGSTGANTIATNRTRATGTTGVTAGGVLITTSTGSTPPGANTTPTTLCTGTLVTSGRPVQLMVSDDGSGNAACFGVTNNGTAANSISATYQLYRDNALISAQQVLINASNTGGNLNIRVPAHYSFVDAPTAGTHTYTLDYLVGNNTWSAYGQYLKLIAYEL